MLCVNGDKCDNWDCLPASPSSLLPYMGSISVLLLVVFLKIENKIKDLAFFTKNKYISRKTNVFLFFFSYSEKYFRTLLQVEMMLKIWFPQMAKERSTAAPTYSPCLHQTWRQNQLHIPVKVGILIAASFVSTDNALLKYALDLLLAFGIVSCHGLYFIMAGETFSCPFNGN